MKDNNINNTSYKNYKERHDEMRICVDLLERIFEKKEVAILDNLFNLIKTHTFRSHLVLRF